MNARMLFAAMTVLLLCAGARLAAQDPTIDAKPGTVTVDPGAPPFDVTYDEGPVPTHQVMPKYPEAALKTGQEGFVLLNVWITREGTVKQALVVESTDAVFEQAAIDAAMQWTFTPAQQEGKPVDVWVKIPFKFRLKTDGSK